MEQGFTVHHRNTHHWDITGKDGRVFRLRGEPGGYKVFDEREQMFRQEGSVTDFPSLQMAMGFVCAELMSEPNLQQSN
ncbi:hypothetical protein GCM10007094_41360 [Pseudovibrio japonicus]|uniref:Uncharacterized protein n=1 Tax=Pseudovibrio japonicus TaxID=366534 RepID=A0ABQ3EN12_9HYPH|nr:hypothetical protein [Pseudovibrio japonicus]GHB47787.1 hypothetical protein GCM10007094_41360 [Pseudovibrio japonicus]